MTATPNLGMPFRQAEGGPEWTEGEPTAGGHIVSLHFMKTRLLQSRLALIWSRCSRTLWALIYVTAWQSVLFASGR